MRPLLLTSLLAAACAEPVALTVPTAHPDASEVAAKADAAIADAGVAADARAAEDALTFSDAQVAADAGIEDGGHASRYPLVLVHGFGASARTLGFARVADDLRALGFQVETADLPPFDSASVRASYLAQTVDRVLSAGGAAKVNLIAHSMGGLDARVLISELGYGDRVASLSTVATPHRGSRFADVSLGLTGLSSTVALDALAAIYGRRISDLGSDTQVRAALQSCSEAAAPAFNAAHPDDARVFYQSWAGLSNVLAVPTRNDQAVCETLLFDPALRDTMDPLLVTTAGFVAHGVELRPNDGLVPVESAKWGLFHGCLPADHLDEVGEFADQPPLMPTGFDFLAHYRAVALDLARRGF